MLHICIATGRRIEVSAYCTHCVTFRFLGEPDDLPTDSFGFAGDVFGLILPAKSFRAVEGAFTEDLTTVAMSCFASLRGFLAAGTGESEAASGSGRLFFFNVAGDTCDEALVMCPEGLIFFAAFADGEIESVSGLPSEVTAIDFSFFCNAFTFMAFCRALLALTASIFAFYGGVSTFM
jgi:hypothetical protein